MTDQPAQTERSYGCTFACGNPYDFVFVSVQDGTTEFLCVPCFVRLAADILAAVTGDGIDANTMAFAMADMHAQERTKGPSSKRRGHNAPTTADDPELFEAFDAVVTADELGDEFK